ncbi:MAG: ATP-binding protein, partial [Pseudomonadota bacterium]|nr:ATP-binding protein [Pseudomonadota bacterium]
AETAIRGALERGGEYYVEFRHRRQSGGIHWIAGSGKVLPGDDGKPQRMLGIGLDVTQRKRAEQTARFLADASASLGQLVDFESTLQKIASLAVPSFSDWATVDVAEADGSLRRVSASHIDPAKMQLAHEVHRRFPADPAAPMGPWNIVRTGRSQIVPEITDDMLVDSIKDEEHLGIIRKLGLRSYIGVPLTVRGKTIGVITFINAETERNYGQNDLAAAEDLASRVAIAIENAQLYRDLQDADRRKDEFLATLAHELRNPLAPLGNAINIRRMSNNPDPLQPVMERQVALLVRLIDDLLDVSRINLDKLTLKRAPTTLQKVLDAALEIASPLIEKGSHPVVRDIPADAIPLDGDHARLSQVFSNLLGNAAKYSPAGQPIEISVSMREDRVRTSIRDHGIGLTPAQGERVFDLFSQVNTSLERSQGGLGIGLSLVRKLVEMHGGKVHVHSDGLDRGSCFTVELPLGNKMPHEPAPSPSAPLALGLRALVVDDNRDAADTLAMALQVFGLDVRALYDPLEASEVATTFDPHLVFLDIGMPGLSGYDLARKLRELHPGQPRVLVAVTGWGQPEDQRRTAEAGFDHHIVKPPDLEALRAICASVAG